MYLLLVFPVRCLSFALTGTVQPSLIQDTTGQRANATYSFARCPVLTHQIHITRVIMCDQSTLLFQLILVPPTHHECSCPCNSAATDCKKTSSKFKAKNALKTCHIIPFKVSTLLSSAVQQFVDTKHLLLVPQKERVCSMRANEGHPPSGIDPSSSWKVVKSKSRQDAAPRQSETLHDLGPWN